MQLVNGEYHLLKSDKIDPSTTTVDPVTIDAANSEIKEIAITDETETSDEMPIETTISQDGSIKAEANNVDAAVKRSVLSLHKTQYPLQLKLK